MMLLAILASACVAVSSGSITAGDLAKVVPGFSPLDPNAAVAYAPTPGVRRILHTGQVRQLLTGLGFKGNIALEDVCFERPVAALPADGVLEAMHRTLGPEAHIEISDLSQLAAPAGEIVFPLEELGIPPVALWRGYIRYDGDKKFRIWARVKISVHAKHLMALEDLRPGIPIKARQVVLKEVEEFPQRRVTPDSLDGIEGALPRRFIMANSPVWADSINPPLDITKGDQITVVVSSGLTKISLDTEAQTSGRRGDFVICKNADSGKLFRARVEAPGKAELGILPLRQ